MEFISLLAANMGYVVNQNIPVSSSKTFNILAVIALAFTVTLVLWLVYIILKDFFKNIFSKRIVAEACLISKVEVPYVTQRVFVAVAARPEVDAGITEKGCVYQFVFEVKGQDRYVTLEVAKDLYDVAVEGSKGTLDYKGTIFHSFDGITEGTVIRTEGNRNDFVTLNSDFSKKTGHK